MDFWNETERGIWTSAFGAYYACINAESPGAPTTRWSRYDRVAALDTANRAVLTYRETLRAGSDYRSAAETPPTPSLLKVGVCVMLWRRGRVLMGERLGSHGANTWSFPGGHVEGGEGPVEAVCREVEEETGFVLSPADVAPVTFTSDVFEVEGKRYVTLYFSASCPSGVEPSVLEPTKCGGWKWVRWGEWPGELFLPIRNMLAQKSKLFPPPRGEK